MPTITDALADFYRARRRAEYEQMWARFTGRKTELLNYEDVRRKVRASKQIDRGLQSVRLDSIVGSVGRYNDFTRSFLPKESTSEQRWARLLVYNETGSGLPPVDLYKLGEAYFVLDGNHRVSIARELGNITIQAYVTEVETRVPVTPDMNPDDLIIAEQYARFLEDTNFDSLLPEVDLRTSVPGKYQLLKEHIEVHQYFMGLDEKRDIEWDEAVIHWHDHVYEPAIERIRARGIVQEFPDRTETDFYIWVAEHRAELEKELGWDLSTEDAVDSLADEKSDSLSGLSERIWDTLTSNPAGQQSKLNRHRERLAMMLRRPHQDRLFSKVLVGIGDHERSWLAVKQAIAVTQREGGQVRGVQLLNLNPAVEEVDQRFQHEMQHSGVRGRLARTHGEWAETLCARARWNDMLVLATGNRPDGQNQLLSRLNSSWRYVLQYSPIPVLLIQDQISPLSKALIAYDESVESKEALYVAAYLAVRWKIPLVVLTVSDDDAAGEGVLDSVRDYLDQYHLADVHYEVQSGDVATNILVTSEMYGCDFLIMGGYKSNPVLELLTDSTVDDVMRNSWQPILICR